MEPADEGTLNPALIRLLILPLVFLRVFAALELQAQQPVQAQHPVRGEFCLVWYNVENLFHPEDDPGTGDDEFTPGGKRNWTWSRYRNKLTAIARVIVASGRGEAPEMVGLCEVENALVLEDLCAHPILGPYRYGYLHKESPDHRGMDVACLIRMGSTEVLQWENMAFRPPVTGTRDLMHICLKMGGDTLDLFLVHLLSKYGGAGATAELRRVQCGQLAAYMDSVHTKRGEGWMMAVGDFNEVYRGYSMEPMRSARFGRDSLTVLLPGEGNGSYKYRGRWSPIDQVLLQQSFPLPVRVSTLQLHPLLTEDLEYGGRKPRRSYEGYSYAGGVSDHLPLLIDLFSPSGPLPESP